MKKHNKSLTPTAKVLRKNMTKQERKFWYECLRNYPVRFLRQKVINKFIVDFYCCKAKLVIEIDGGQHYTAEGVDYDKERTEVIESYGLKVIRFSNLDIDENFEAVCIMVDEEVRKKYNPPVTNVTSPFNKGTIRGYHELKENYMILNASLE